MKTYIVDNDNGVGLYIPTGYCFAFNPNKIIVENGKSLKVDIIADIDNKPVSYRDERTGYKDLELDISPYLQLLSEENGHKPTKVTVKYDIEDVNGDTAINNFNLTAIWGAIAIGDKYPGGTFRRWFKAYDDNNTNKYQIFIPSNIDNMFIRENGGEEREVLVPSNKGLVDITAEEYFKTGMEDLRTARITMVEDTSSTFDQTFDSTFFDLGGGVITIDIVFDDRKIGKFLKWVSRSGMTYMYLFEVGDEKTTTDDVGEDYNVDFGTYEYDYYGVTRNTRKRTSKTVNICAPLLSQKEMEYVSTIIDSQDVQEYDYNEGTWKPLRVNPGEYIIMDWEKKPLQDFETQIVYPQIILQEL